MTQHYDTLIESITDYVCESPEFSHEAYDTATNVLMDSLACALQAHEYPACTKLLGPSVPGATLAGGARVIGASHELDPATAAFNNGALIRWLDFNDTWLAAEWGHPSDNLGAILAAADYVNRKVVATGAPGMTMQAVLDAMIMAHEIQGVLALNHSFNRAGLDHVLLVRVASTAIATKLLGGNKQQIKVALSHAFADGGALRTYRHAPNTGSRKSWAAGDACRRAMELALIALRQEMGINSVLTAEHWGFQDVLFKGQPLELAQPLNDYVMENILFKISFPAEFHAQTAVECAMALHKEVSANMQNIERIEVETQEPGVRIIDKSGPLNNPADRDHCLQYMIAVPLIFGRLTAADYEDDIASDPRIDELRAKMQVSENETFTKDYYDAEKRYIPNAITVYYKDGSHSERVEISVPIGHRERRVEGMPKVKEKFATQARAHLNDRQQTSLIEWFEDYAQLKDVELEAFMSQLVAL